MVKKKDIFSRPFAVVPAFCFSEMVLINILDEQVEFKCVLMALISPSDQFRFLGNCPPPPPLSQH